MTLQILTYLSFSVSLFAMTRQYPFPELSGLISIGIVLVFAFSALFVLKSILNSEGIIKKLFILNMVFLTILIPYAIFLKGNDVGTALRFFIILVLVLTSFFLPRRKFFVDAFLVIAVLHSLFIIGFELYIVWFSDPTFATHIRNTVLNLGVGDIYTYNGYFYRIQIKGNAILPIAFLVSLFALKEKWLKISVATILFLGTFIAGNLAFMVAIAAYFIFYLCLYLYKLLRSKREKIKETFFTDVKRTVISLTVLISLTLAICIPLFSYLNDVMVRKSEYSIPARFDQVEVLFDDLLESPTSALFGQGLGNTLQVETEYRDYTNNTYFELQTLYILNQVGILYMILFVITKAFFVYKFWDNSKIYVLYGCYLLYALSNPYVFDTTNIIILIVLSSLNKLLTKEGTFNEGKV
jgi:hypothetical protein